jgi:hypothetical protein
MPGDLDSQLEAPNMVVPAPPPEVTSNIHIGSSQYLYVSGWYLGKHIFVNHLITPNHLGTHLMNCIAFPLHTEIPPNTQGEFITSTIWDLEQRPDLNGTQDCRLCEDQFISVFTDRASIRVIVVPLVVQSPPLNSRVAAPLTEIAIAPHIKVFSFDPTSGRMCGYTGDDDLVIYDFLKQPLPANTFSETSPSDF